MIEPLNCKHSIGRRSHWITWQWIIHLMLALNIICVFEEGIHLLIYHVLNAYSCKSCPVKPVWSCLALISAELVPLSDDGTGCQWIRLVSFNILFSYVILYANLKNLQALFCWCAKGRKLIGNVHDMTSPIKNSLVVVVPKNYQIYYN